MKSPSRLAAICFVAVIGVLTLLAPWQSAAPAATVPGAPTNLAATPGDSQVTLTWGPRRATATPRSRATSTDTSWADTHIWAEPYGPRWGRS